MFTLAGKQLVSKFLLGQTPAFGSYIAIGCGETPLVPGDATTVSNVELKHSLTFESARAKIISRGYVNDGINTNMVLTAELPTEERYAITEIGLFPSQMNDAAGAIDSKVLFRFNETESWVANNAGTYVSIPQILKLDSDLISSTKIVSGGTDDLTTLTPQIISVAANDVGFINTTRIENQEIPRFLTNSIMIRGNGATEQIVQLSGLSLDLSKNSPGDYLKLAYSVITDDINDMDILPSAYTIKIKFFNASGAYHTLQTTKTDAINLSTSRYQVYTTQIKDLVPTTVGGATPTLSGITRVQVSVTGLSSDYWIDIDGFRLDAENEYTAVYDLVAYRQISNIDDYGFAVPIVKDANSLSYIEFRFNIAIGG